MSLKRKYVDSHWLIFALQGTIALLFGWFSLFVGIESICVFIPAIGMFLLLLGIIELFNLLCRTHLKETWGLTLAMALLEIVASFALLFTLDMKIELGPFNKESIHLVIIAAYVVIRGLLEIILGFRAIDDRTDRFIWVLLGICGCVMGFVILNTGDFTESIDFIKVFGAYLSLVGIGNLIYGVHNRDQAKEFAEARHAARKVPAKKPDAIQTIKGIKSAETVKFPTKAKAIAKKPAARKPATKKITAKSTTKPAARKAVTKKTPSRVTTRSAATRKTTAHKTTKRRR